MDTPTLSDRERRAFLPVFFAVLDPARIPNADKLEELLRYPKDIEAIGCADVSLGAVLDLRPPNAIGPSLWPRVWPWVHFFHTYREHLNRIPLMPETHFYPDVLLFAASLIGDDSAPTSELIYSAPGFWDCFIEGWKLLTRGVDDPDSLVYDLGVILAESNLGWHPERLQAMIDAAGSIQHLAGLIVDYIRTVNKRPAVGDAQSHLDDIDRLVAFLTAAEQLPDADEAPTDLASRLGPLGRVLYERGCAEELVGAIFLLCDTIEEHTDWVMQRWLDAVPVTPVVRFPSTVLQLLLPTALVYLPVVVAYRDALKDVQDLLSRDDFKNTGLFEDWQQFFAMADERVEALAEFESPFFEPKKACDNSKCGIIQKSFCLQQCSGCQVFYYCSVECQRSDWEHGHRDTCRFHRSLLLSECAAQPKLTFKERSFLRALVQNKYLKDRRSICAAQVRALSQYDPEKHGGLFTVFDYSKAVPIITVYPVPIDPSNVPAQSPFGVGEWTWERTWVIPLRTNGTALYGGLKKLSHKFRRGELAEADLMVEIDSLLESTTNIVEIH
ncbi:hypothetical protein FB45DRAFT_1054235 [Roridomyces roridus]|uniref:MYND-type domain-containing protein n=1 Tax=Roridomyces roridus TaxID=1738132 RepID=A0AAD7C892_9AGAR|nr:hypothetical protein FB45DRAFT_1054235 [Roridomyces roridus]